MRRRTALRGARVLALGVAALGFVPVAHASSPSTTLTPATEAWFQPDPTCNVPIGCQAGAASGVATNVYPAGSLHVSVAAGTETARSYLAFDWSGVEGTVNGATLDIPLDTSALDGSVSPDTSHVEACTFTAKLTALSGSFAQPPYPNCSAYADLTYVATPQPHLHGDLTPLADALTQSSGIALLPDGELTTQADTWHVAFSAHDRTDAAKTDPVTLSLTLATATPSDPSSAGAAAPTDVATSAAAATATYAPVAAATAPAQVPAQTQPEQVTIPAAPLTATVPSAQAPAPLVAGVATAAPAQVEAQQPQAFSVPTVPVGLLHPAVWLIPLAFVLLLPLAGSILTRDLTPKR